MPELPEIETQRRITELIRHGKNLALVADDGRALCFHLGMSGQVRFVPGDLRLEKSDHVHCLWWIDSCDGTTGRLVFRDPRRFGGLWAFDSVQSLWRERLDRLGPDALTITAATLRERIGDSRRAIKAALLDQSAIAGVGNIYADEALFQSRIHPAMLACDVPRGKFKPLTRAIHNVLRAAVSAGGSTIRSYIDANGAAGGFVQSHQVYGRAGEPCLHCATPLQHTVIGQRSTVFCRGCQPVPQRTRHQKLSTIQPR